MPSRAERTEESLFRYFEKNARYYPDAGPQPYYALVSPVTGKVVRANDSAVLMDKLRKEAGLPLQEA